MVATYIGGNAVSNLYAQGKKIRKAYKNGTLFYSRNLILTNMIYNGSFETNTTEWSGSTTLTRIAKNPSHSEYGSYVGQVSGRTNGNIYVQRSSAQTDFTSGRKYYIRSKVRSVIAGYAYMIQYMNATTALSGSTITDISSGEDNGWSIYDMIWTANTSSLRLRLNFTGGIGYINRTIQFDNIMIINLTEAFGSGNEPTLIDIRDIVNFNGGYWDGSLAV